MLFLQSCSYHQRNQKGIEIVIEIVQSYKIDLKAEIYTVYFLTKEPLEIKFQLTEEERREIIDLFDSLKYNRKVDWEYIGDSCWDAPKLYTIVSIKPEEKIHKVYIDIGCGAYYHNDEQMAIQYKRLILLIRKILKSKKEIKEAPKSDIGYF
jgi:hypothetical protein